MAEVSQVGPRAYAGVVLTEGVASGKVRKTQRVYRILSIDGGGIRGIIPAVVLAELERQSGKRVHQLFDMFAGTSTGGILSLALSQPGRDGVAHWRASEIVDLYVKHGPEIFDRSLLHRIRSVGSILDEKYPDTGLVSVLKRYFGETRLSEALVEVLVTAYELEGRDPFFFKRRKAIVPSGEDDYPMWQVARATAAAPTYFEPLKLDTPSIAGYYALVDGGVFANNPAMCAYADAHRFEEGADIVLVSLGTGQLERPIRYDDAKDWGQLEWARPVLDVVFDGVADTTDYELRQLMNDDRYFRLQTTLIGNDQMDDASPSNTRALLLRGEDLVSEAEHAGFFKRVLPLLLPKARPPAFERPAGLRADLS